MPVANKIYIVGAGAIGMSLAVNLIQSGRSTSLRFEPVIAKSPGTP